MSSGWTSARRIPGVLQSSSGVYPVIGTIAGLT